jgi:hypothetical protein
MALFYYSCLFCTSGRLQSTPHYTLSVYTTGRHTNHIIVALVRWPPMGRKKFMLDNVLRGRNELIQDSIRRDTGIVRDRKQVSSHLQVLKQHLQNQPGGEYFSFHMQGLHDLLAYDMNSPRLHGHSG